MDDDPLTNCDSQNEAGSNGLASFDHYNLKKKKKKEGGWGSRSLTLTLSKFVCSEAAVTSVQLWTIKVIPVILITGKAW